MKSVVRGTLRLLTWLAVLWTIYEEQHHLALYIGNPAMALGIGEYIDIAVTLLLLGYAIYEVFQFAGRTYRVERYLAAHPGIDALIVVMLAALGWGIYRDVSHFQHRYLSAEGALPFGDAFDEAAAAFLVLGVIKTGYHAVRALRGLRRLLRRM